jgi:hypothetical protein
MHEHQFVFVCGFSEIYYNIFDVFRTEPRFFRIPSRTEPNSEPNRPTFVKNLSGPSEIKKFIPHTPTIQQVLCYQHSFVAMPSLSQHIDQLIITGLN